VPARSNAPITQVVRGSWEDGTAEFATGSRAGDAANKRHNRNAVRLRKLREELRLSVTTVAKWAGLDRETVSNMENGLSSPDAVSVHRVAVVLGLDSELRSDPNGRIGP
jgi:DNA-binding XRE family transcriptional regulator